MKIGFFGNTNNYPFMLARALQRQGVDVLFCLNSAYALHRPEYAYSDISRPYPSWILDLGQLRPIDYVLPTGALRRAILELRKCDMVVLNGFGPTLSRRIGRPSMALLTGSDVSVLGDAEYPEVASADTRRRPLMFWRPLKRKLYHAIVEAQRNGIGAAAAVSYFPRGIDAGADSILDDIGVVDDKRVFLMMADTSEVSESPLPNNNPIRLMCGTRLTWKLPLPVGFVPLDNKGSDVMVRGVAMYQRKYRTPYRLSLVKKGLNVGETIELVRQEEIESSVEWLSEMPLDQLRMKIRESDVVLEQFGTSMMGMAGLEAMAMGRPVIADVKPRIMESAVGVRSPVCHAETPEEICESLHSLIAHPEKQAAIARSSREYVEKYCSSDAAALRVLKLFGV